LTTPFNIDSAAKAIMKLFVDDFLNAEKTESSKANEHESSSYKPSSIPEAKTNKTADVMESLDRLIQSDNKLHVCIDPLRQQLSSNNDARQISECETCLQRLQPGLINQQFVSIDGDVMSLCLSSDDEERRTSLPWPMNEVNTI
jgi:hypothetical protein